MSTITTLQGSDLLSDSRSDINTNFSNLNTDKLEASDITGKVDGPASSTDNAIARYDSTTGKVIQNSGATIDDSGNLTANNVTGTNTGDQTSIVGITGTTAEFNTALSDGSFATGGGTATGTNTGDQTSIVGITGTKAEFDTACTDGNFLYEGEADVVGPASSTDNAITRFDGTTGKLVQNSGATIDDSGNLTANNISGTNTGDQDLSNYVDKTTAQTVGGIKTFSDDIVTGTGKDLLLSGNNDGTGSMIGFGYNGAYQKITSETNTETGSDLSFYNSQGSNTNGGFTFRRSDGGDIWMKLNNSGNLGIGTTSPNQKLTVEGTASLKEQASANADTAGYGQIWVKSDTPNTLWFTDDAGNDSRLSNQTESFVLACSDLTSDLTTGTSKAYFRVPYGFTLTEVRASVLTAPTGSVLTVDINENGTTILSTKITIDATEKTSTTATTAPVISDTSLADDAEITIDIDTVGSTVAGAGLIVTLIGYKS